MPDTVFAILTTAGWSVRANHAVCSATALAQPPCVFQCIG
jgi:hypothetical protein